MIDFNLVLETNTIKLRPLIKEDLTLYAELTGDKSMWIYFTSDLSDFDELTKWIDDALTQTSDKKRLAFSVINKDNNQIMGSTSFGNISYCDKRIEIGWTWIGKDFRGKGINNQMKFLMLKYCFEVLNFERAELKTDVLNIAARKAMSGMGFVEEGILRSHTLMIHNRRRDTIYYSILKPEWEEMKIRNKWT